MELGKIIFPFSSLFLLLPTVLSHVSFNRLFIWGIINHKISLVYTKHAITSFLRKSFIRFSFKARCHARFQRAFTACCCVFKEITLVSSNQYSYFEEVNARLKSVSQLGFINSSTFQGRDASLSYFVIRRWKVLQYWSLDNALDFLMELMLVDPPHLWRSLVWL